MQKIKLCYKLNVMIDKPHAKDILDIYLSFKKNHNCIVMITE